MVDCHSHHGFSGQQPDGLDLPGDHDGMGLSHVEEAVPDRVVVAPHRHLPLEIDLSTTSKYVNLGDWISYYTYGVFDGVSLSLEYFEKDA